MIGLQYYRYTPTNFDLNGPILSFLQEPTSKFSCNTGIATFVGIATATFPGQTPPNPAIGLGTISYRWYEDGVGPLSDNVNISGSGTTTLTINNIISPNDSGRSFYLSVDYINFDTTPNAINDNLQSDTATLTVYPDISIATQPNSAVTLVNDPATFSIIPTSTDLSIGSFLYQWQLDGVDISDGQYTSTFPATQVDLTYTTDTSFTLPSDATDIFISVAGASGGKGGNDSGGSGGNGGSGRFGTFSLPDGPRTLSFRIGNSGNNGGSGNFNAFGAGGLSNVSSGGRGGGAGGSGWSGGGAGGGGATGVFDSLFNDYIIVAGGGGGGGGGSLNASASFGSPAKDWERNTGSFSISPGSAGQDKGGDGGGGGGGGGGALGGEGGQAGQDNSFGGRGGNGGGSKYVESACTLTNETLNFGSGYINLKFKTQTSIPGITTVTSRTTTILGSKTQTLQISSNSVGIQTVQCKVSNTAACNSPIYSNSSILTVISPDSANRSIIGYEIVGENNTTLYDSGEQNIFNAPINFQSDPTDPFKAIILYPTERDVNVKITLAASSGKSFNNFLGGEGGLSIFEYTLKKNTEYVFKLNPTLEPFGGKGGGGGGAFFYEKALLLAVCGGGGGAASNAKGGSGGGCGIAGQSGIGRNAGRGGSLISSGSLSGSGLSVSGFAGGRVESCTIGSYYQSLGFSPCSDVGEKMWRNSSGSEIANTATLIRGYKSGTNFRSNGGNSSILENSIFIGGGGSGAVGGDATQSSGSSGGGASGYTNGSVNIISSQLGGNPLEYSYAIIEFKS